jgi:hypothetical protein
MTSSVDVGEMTGSMLDDPVELLERRDEGAVRGLELYLDRFHEGRAWGSLEWILRPMLHEPFLGRAGRPGSHVALLASHVLSAQVRRRGVRAYSQAPVTFAIDGVNLARVLTPIMMARRPISGKALRILPEMDQQQLLRCTKLATGYATSLVRTAREVGLPVSATQVHQYCLAGARALARANSLVKTGRTKLLVVGTQHAPNMRALLAIARQREIPSVYFPHAPAADNRQYADLPCDYAGLRGAGEVHLYRRLGVDGDLPVVGNPAVPDVIGGQPRTLSEDPVFAVSPHPPAVLADLFRLAASVLGGENVVVAPHPRSDVRHLMRFMPPSWRLVPGGRTLDVLRRGPRFVVQHSSGVAWEALALGIPVIQIGYVDARANYPLIASPFALFAHSTATLSDAVEEASRRSSRRDDRDELRRWATHWCGSVGREATEACSALIQQALAGGPRPELLLDGWRHG